MVENLSPLPAHEPDADLQGDASPVELWNGGFRIDTRKARKPSASHPWFYRGRFALNGHAQEDQPITGAIEEDVFLESIGYGDENAESDVIATQVYTVTGILEKANLQVTFTKKVLLTRLLKDAGADLSNRSAIPLSPSELNAILRQLK